MMFMSQISSATSLDQITFIFQFSVMTMEIHNCSKYGEKLGFEYPAMDIYNPFCKAQGTVCMQEEKDYELGRREKRNQWNADLQVS